MRMLTRLGTILVLIVVPAILLVFAFTRAGMTRGLLESVFIVGPERSTRPIKLRIWDWWSPSGNENFGRYFAELERTFESRHPNVELCYEFIPFGSYVQKLATAMVGRTPPDVFQASVFWAQGFYDRGMLRPLNDLFQNEGEEALAHRVAQDVFLPSAWRHNHTTDHVVFGIPEIIDAACLVWNLDRLQEVARHDRQIRDMFVHHSDGSIDYDRIRFDAVTDWAHFRQIMRKLTSYQSDGTVEQAGFLIQAYGGGADMFSPWLASNGGRYQDEAGTKAMFNGPTGVATMHFLANLYWKDRVCPPFRRQIQITELFEEGKVAVIAAGTWSGVDIIRNTMGWRHFGKTAFPPGPTGRGQRTVCWGNMLVISRRCRNVEAAWRYIKFVCGLEGNLMRLKHLGYNGPRLDLYETEDWQRAQDKRPYLSNVKSICLAGDKLRHSEIIAADHQANPVIETILLSYPDIAAGRGPFASVSDALDQAAANVTGVYRRYNEQVAKWLAARAETKP